MSTRTTRTGRTITSVDDSALHVGELTANEAEQLRLRDGNIAWLNEQITRLQILLSVANNERATYLRDNILERVGLDAEDRFSIENGSIFHLIPHEET